MNFFFSNKKIYYYFFLFIFLILAFFLRFYKFNQIGFWGDEYITFALSGPFQIHDYKLIHDKSLREVGDYSPAFYYFVLNIYNFLVGEYTASSIRSFSVIFGSLNILLSFLISRMILDNKQSMLVLYLLTFNVFLIWCSTEARPVSFVLFFQLLSILFFFYMLKNINTKFFILYTICLFFINFFSLTSHPLSIIVILSQFFFLILKNNLHKKKFLLLVITLSVIFYLIINIEYFIFRFKESFLLSEQGRVSHNRLTVNFFIGYNFKHYFNSYILGGIHLIITVLMFLKIFKKASKYDYLFYLFLIFVLTYLFIIIGTLFFKLGLNGQKYWSYLVPIVIITNIFYLDEIKKNFLSILLTFFFIIYTPLIYLDRINKPEIRKPDTLGLIKIFNETKINYIVSENYHYFENYLKKGYKNFNKKIVTEIEINSLKEDFWYLCLDLSWVPVKGSYYDEIYECSPKLKNIYAHKKMNSIKLNGFVITEYKYLSFK